MEELRETMIKFLWLNGIYLYNLIQYAKKFILIYPPELLICSLNFRPTVNRGAGKCAMVIILTFCKMTSTSIPTKEALPADQLPLTNPLTLESPLRPIMNMIIWNCTGAHNDKF